MNGKKWVAYGVTGLVGIGIISGGAAAVASSMDLRTEQGTVVPGGAITERSSVLDRDKVQLRATNSSVTVVSAPSPRSVDSRPSAPSPHSPDSSPSPHSPDSPPSPASPPSAHSPDSPNSAPSADSD